MGDAVLINLQIGHRSAIQGFIAGVLQFNDASELHFREFVNVTQADPRLMYAYHYQNADKHLILRYDNAPHRPALPQATYKHTPSGVEVSAAPTLAQVVDEILELGSAIK